MDALFERLSFLGEVVRNDRVNGFLRINELLETFLADRKPASAGTSEENHDGTKEVAEGEGKDETKSKICQNEGIRIIRVDGQPTREGTERVVHGSGQYHEANVCMRCSGRDGGHREAEGKERM